MVTSAYPATKPVRALGGFFAMSLDTFVMIFRRPFAWREYILQTWFVARVTTLPALVMVIPYGLFDFDRAISCKSGLRPAVCGCSGSVSGGPSWWGCGSRRRRV